MRSKNKLLEEIKSMRSNNQGITGGIKIVLWLLL